MRSMVERETRRSAGSLTGGFRPKADFSRQDTRYSPASPAARHLNLTAWRL